MRSVMRNLLVTLLVGLPLMGCANQMPIPSVAHVDVPRYMGDWYVIASIPSYFERDAYRAVESYTLGADGRVQTMFTYRAGGLDGKLKAMHATGFIRPDTGNAVWGMQFVWPIRAEYIIAWLDSNYRTVIVARSKRDYVWIMARTPTIPQAQYEQLIARVKAMGYDVSKLRKVPQ